MFPRGRTFSGRPWRPGSTSRLPAGAKDFAESAGWKSPKEKWRAPGPRAFLKRSSRRGVRLACQTRIRSDMEVRVPVESRLDRRVIARTRERVGGGRRASHQELESLVLGWCFNPALRKVYVEVEPPTLKDNRSDLTRLLLALKRELGFEGIFGGFPPSPAAAIYPAGKRLESHRYRRADPDGIAAWRVSAPGFPADEADQRGAGGHDPGALLDRAGHRHDDASGGSCWT